MSCKNIDVIAVFFIAIVMAGFSQIRSFTPLHEMNLIRFQNTSELKRCPISDGIISRIDYLLNQ